MKDWNIDMIQAMSESEARGMALETMQIKGHTVYFVDFEGYFGYSALVFADGMHIYYANEYELHHRQSKLDRAGLKKRFVKYLNGKLFTEDEITGPITTYDEYRSKSNYLHNYYGMRREHVSIFGICRSGDERKAYEERVAGMTYNPICFAYFDDVGFIEHHVELFAALEESWDAHKNDFEILKSAFISEMFNHEYAINYQGDWDVLSVWGNIEYYRGGPEQELQSYFDQLHFTDTQRRAYLAARKEYLRMANEPDD